MKVKFKQRYSNECGKCALNNLLAFDKIEKKEVDVNVTLNGSSINDLTLVLEKYFYKVEAIKIDINEIKKVKHFVPFIALLTKNEKGHYVVVYKKNKKYLFILDSLARYSYKVTYENFANVFLGSVIIAEDIKKSEIKKKDYLTIIFVFIISFIETLMSLFLSSLLKQLIDNKINDGINFIIVELLILFFTYLRIISFYKTLKKYNKTIVNKTLINIFNLKENYIENHEIDEIIYRSFDAINVKDMKLSFIFEFINDITLLVLASALLIKYSLKITLFVFFFSIFLVFFALIFFKKLKIAIEKRRISEYEFINSYKENFLNKRKDDSLEKMQKYLKDDLDAKMLESKKNYLYFSFQTIIFISVIILYFTNLLNDLSLGSIVAIFNVLSLMLTPFLNVLSLLSNFANFKECCNRIEDIEKNLK